MPKDLENDNPHTDAFRRFIETLDISSPDNSKDFYTNELSRLQRSIAISTEAAMEAFFEGEAENKISQMVHKSLIECGYRIDSWDEYELGLYACVLVNTDYMMGGVLARQFPLLNDEATPLRIPKKIIKKIDSIVPGFDMHVVGEYFTAFAESGDEYAIVLSRKANDSILNHEG